MYAIETQLTSRLALRLSLLLTKVNIVNKKEAIAAAKAAKKAGLNVKPIPSAMINGGILLMRVYNRAGDSTGFNPYTNLGDAMQLAMNTGLATNFRQPGFSVSLGDSIIKIENITGGKKSSQYRIGNAIVNFINLYC